MPKCIPVYIVRLNVAPCLNVSLIRWNLLIDDHFINIFNMLTRSKGPTVWKILTFKVDIILQLEYGPMPNVRDGRPAEYRWRLLRKFRNSIPCTTPQSLADAGCWSAMQ